tara:strand:+ start:2366 stop:2974 length:609 start_codon:yes stop_codon:yes gene_type:complete
MTDKNNEQHAEQAALNDEFKPSIEDEINREAEVLAMAKTLGLDDGDFDPKAAGVQDETPLTKEEKEAQQRAELVNELKSEAGSLFAASKFVGSLEFMFKKFGHHKFAIAADEKQETIEAIKPAIQKYSGSLVSMMGDYEAEVMAAIAVGSLTYGSINQIKALKAMDKEKVVNSNENPEADEQQAQHSEPMQPEAAPEQPKAA